MFFRGELFKLFLSLFKIKFSSVPLAPPKSWYRLSSKFYSSWPLYLDMYGSVWTAGEVSRT